MFPWRFVWDRRKSFSDSLPRANLNLFPSDVTRVLQLELIPLKISHGATSLGFCCVFFVDLHHNLFCARVPGRVSSGGVTCFFTYTSTVKTRINGPCATVCTSYRHKEPEHRDKKYVWQIVCAHLTAHTKFGLKCFSGSLCL